MLYWALVTPAGLGHPEGISHWEKTIPYFLFLLKGGGGVMSAQPATCGKVPYH